LEKPLEFERFVRMGQIILAILVNAETIEPAATRRVAER